METDDVTLNSGSDHEMTTGSANETPPTKMDTDSDQPLANDCTSSTLPCYYPTNRPRPRR